MDRATTSASNIHRRYLCPGSERMEAGLPDEDSEQSLEGQLLHDHMANPGKSRKKLKAAQRDLLEGAERLVREIFNRVHAQFGLGEFTTADTGGTERTLYLHRGIKKLFPGHCDLWDYIATIKLLVIIDHKFGYKVVTSAAANLQLRSYAVMGAEEHDCDHVVVAITQPRLSFDDRLTMAIYSRADIEASRQQLYQIWDDCKKPDAPLNPSAEACQYCKAKLLCPAYQEKVREGLSIVPAPTGGTLANREATITQSLAQCSDEQLGRFLDACAFASFAAEFAKDVARERLHKGGMHGWKLGKESEVREVTDVMKAFKLLTDAGLDPVKVNVALKMTMGPVEEIYRDAKGGTWRDAKDAINQLLGGVIAKHTKKASVQRDTAALKDKAA